MASVSQAPYPAWQPLYDRLPASTLFEGELLGRRLLQVWALRQQGQTYASDLDAESYWLQLAGDSPETVIWVRPEWTVNFFDKTWRLLPRAVASPRPAHGMQRAGPALLQQAGDVWLQRHEWQSLQGLVLAEMQIANGYCPHVAALALRFAGLGAAVQTPGSLGYGCLLFDWGHAPDDMDSTAMLYSPDARLGRWPLWDDGPG